MVTSLIGQKKRNCIKCSLPFIWSICLFLKVKIKPDSGKYVISRLKLEAIYATFYIYIYIIKYSSEIFNIIKKMSVNMKMQYISLVLKLSEDMK